MAKELLDTDIMPFGKHKGKQMIDVPAGWLLWYLDNGSPGNIMDYCKAREKALRKEKETGSDARFEPKSYAHTPSEATKTSPKLSAREWLKKENLLENLSIDEAEALIDLIERYRAYYTGTKYFKSKPPIDKSNPTTQEVTDYLTSPSSGGGGFFSSNRKDEDIVSKDDLPF